jgi:hypothetical protein
MSRVETQGLPLNLAVLIFFVDIQTAKAMKRHEQSNNPQWLSFILNSTHYGRKLSQTCDFKKGLTNIVYCFTRECIRPL